MTVAVIVLAIAVAVLAFLVAGLLRSHATILRSLHDLGVGIETDDDVRPSSPPVGSPAVEPVDLGLPQPPAVLDGRPAADLEGAGPRGEVQAIRVAGTEHDTVLVFLSSGCTTCHSFFDDLADPQLPGATRLVIVTKAEDAESPVAIRSTAPAGVTVVMSSQAWLDYEVPGSPYVVHVDGPSGRVRGEGTGPSWEQVRRMLLDGASDLDEKRRRGPVDRESELRRKAASDARREDEVDHILLDAGIQPGDPSLYTRADGTVERGRHGITELPDTVTQERP